MCDIYRMRSVIDHLKTREFPRLKIGKTSYPPNIACALLLVNLISMAILIYGNVSKALDDHRGKWTLSIMSSDLSIKKKEKRYSLFSSTSRFFLFCVLINLFFNQTLLHIFHVLLQLDFMFQRGLEAVRILVHEGLDKSATFANSARPAELLN